MLLLDPECLVTKGVMARCMFDLLLSFISLRCVVPVTHLCYHTGEGERGPYPGHDEDGWYSCSAFFFFFAI